MLESGSVAVATRANRWQTLFFCRRESLITFRSQGDSGARSDFCVDRGFSFDPPINMSGNLKEEKVGWRIDSLLEAVL